MGILDFLFGKSKAVEKLDKIPFTKNIIRTILKNHIFLTKEIYENGWSVQKCFQVNL